MAGEYLTARELAKKHGLNLNTVRQRIKTGRTGMGIVEPVATPRRIKIKGLILSSREVKEKFGVTPVNLASRIRAGWDPERAATIPQKKRREYFTELFGKDVSLDELQEISGLKKPVIKRRLDRGNTAEQVVLTPRFRESSLTLDGKTLIVREWAIRLGIKENTIRKRMAAGLPAKETLNARRLTKRPSRT